MSFPSNFQRWRPRRSFRHNNSHSTETRQSVSYNLKISAVFSILLLAVNLPILVAWTIVPATQNSFVSRLQPLAVGSGPTNKNKCQEVLPWRSRSSQNCAPLWAKKKSIVDDDDEDDEEAYVDDDEEVEFDEDGDWEEEDEEEEDADVEFDDEEEEYVDEDEEEEDYEFEDDDDDEDEDDEAIEEEDEDEILDESDILAAKSAGTDDWEESVDDDEVEEVEYEEFEDEYEDVERTEPTFELSEEWDEDDDVPLEDDPNDPDYQAQKRIMEEAVKASGQVEADRSFDAMDYLMNQMTPEQVQELDKVPFVQEAKTRAQQLQLSESDIEGMDIEEEAKRVPDLMDDDPYPRHDEDEVNFLDANIGVTDDMMENLDDAWKTVRQRQQETPWDKVMVREIQGMDGLSNETLEEIEACLDFIGGSAYNVTRWLLYDLDFNVTNLMLAAVQHNRDAPILFQHWYPQLVTYARYKSAQTMNFDFTWDDVEAADISELERYYIGMGYDEIPTKAPAETGIIEFDYLDEEEIKMAAFENWVKEVYNPEWDRKDFDDDDMRDEDNVFSDFYEPPQHPDFPTFEDAQEDIEAWREEIGTDEELSDKPEAKSYRDFMAMEKEYEYVEDKEFEEEFRGHLVVACTGDDEDLEIAEKITIAMDDAFGKQIYVETRLLAHAREEDSVFEVWLESYEIELLHSKKRATSNAKGWNGPAVCDDAQVEHLVDRVKFLISDDARYSYSLEFDGAE